ncbi:MAG: VWA domain-containing protein, partial [Deltaproteobacteria bacterium]|nr:VWA domain-containing protein [Deltaproteobacteria bacterium]
LSSLNVFYYLARALLVKSETYYDQYDQAFSACFGKIKTRPEITDEVLEWLQDPLNRLSLDPEELERLQRMDLDELRRLFEERLREQTERHDGGGRWIGTGGTSPFGHSGAHPAGIRIGGPGGGGRAIQVAAERRFRNYRTDVTLDVRQIKVALKRLRHFQRTGPEDELDLEATIDETCKNAGEIELIFGRARKNTVKVCLMMDSGGSMTPFAHLVNRLFSAAHQMAHFKDLKYFYFHNCIYQDLYADIYNSKSMPTAQVLANLDSDYKLILVGDAHMSPSELFSKGGAIDYYYHNEQPGIEWLQRTADHFRYAVWLNPITRRQLWVHPTIKAVGRIFPMFEMTVDGLEEAVKALMVRR